MAEKYLVLSFDDERAKHISEVFGNKTCKKILNILIEQEASVTDVSRQLKIPLNTADYNIKKLIQAGLIETKSHFWSVKGKKIPVYKVSNKKILISPKKSNLANLKTILPIAVITGMTALLVRYFVMPLQAVSDNQIFRESTKTLAGSTQAVTQASQNSFLAFISNLNPWAWFLIGAWFAVAIFFILNLKRNE